MSESSRPILSNLIALDSVVRILCSSSGTANATNSLSMMSCSKSSDLFGLSSGSIGALVAAAVEFGLWSSPKARRGKSRVARNAHVNLSLQQAML
jgi:hypothetical protein